MAQFIVTSGVADTAMVNAITGAGIAVSNVTNNGVTPKAMGLFTCSGGCNLGLQGGIILTSGDAAIAALANSGTGQGAAINNLSDPQLATLTTGTTKDACVLEFDFVAASDSVRFEYVFGSEEYDDYVNSQFNDVFGFFISGPGISGSKNIALVPGTNIPIAINNVNNGGPVSHGVPPPGPCNNCAYYISNTVPPLPKTTAYDGVTTVLTALAGNLVPGSVYHLKLAISDVGDQVFDSGALIGTGSFYINGPVWLFSNGQKVSADTLSVCAGDTVNLSGPAGFSYLWNTGATTQSIAVTSAGTYSLTVTGSNPSMPAGSDAIVFVVDTTNVPVPVLSVNGNQLVSSITGPPYTYSWLLNGTPVAGSSSVFSFSQSGCYAVVVTDPGGCFAVSDTLCVSVTGIAGNDPGSSLVLFPNPASRSVVIDGPSAAGPVDLFVFDIHGRVVMILRGLTGFPVTLAVASLPKGVYQVMVGDERSGAYAAHRLAIQ